MGRFPKIGVFSGAFAQRETEEDGRRRAETRMEEAAAEEGLPAAEGGHLFSDDQKSSYCAD